MEFTTRTVPTPPRPPEGFDKFLLGDPGKPTDVTVDVVRNNERAYIEYNLKAKSDFDSLDFYLPLAFFILIGAFQTVVSLVASPMALMISFGLQALLLVDLFRRVARSPSGKGFAGYVRPYRRKDWAWSFGVYAACLPVLLGLACANFLLYRLVRPEYDPAGFLSRVAAAGPGTASHGQQLAVGGAALLALLVVFVGLVVLAPVTEELWFRGVGLASFLAGGSRTRAAVLTSVVFGVLHGPSQMLFATAFGFVMAFVRFRTGSVRCCMAVHMVHNFLVLTAGVFLTF